MEKEIVTFADLMYTFAHCSIAELVPLIRAYANKENLPFPKTDKEWIEAILKAHKQDEEVNLFNAFRYEVNDYLEECRHENSEAFKNLNMLRFYS